MCARELNSEVATTGPCSEEAYWYGRCRAMESDVDVSNVQLYWFEVFVPASAHLSPIYPISRADIMIFYKI